MHSIYFWKDFSQYLDIFEYSVNDSILSLHYIIYDGASSLVKLEAMNENNYIKTN